MSIEELRRNVIALVHRAAASTGNAVPTGASDAVISGFEMRTGLIVPPNLRSWLKTSNGPCIGFGGLYGIRPEQSFLDIEGTLQLHPEWKELGWIPIASDGCGNEYCVITRNDFGEGEPVVFIDTLEGSTKPTYVVASDTWHFLWFYLSQFLEEVCQSNDSEEILNRPISELAAETNARWPFNHEIVLREDPGIVRFRAATLPWEA